MRSPRPAYTLVETVVVVGLMLLAALATVVGARTWQASQRTDRALATQQVVVEVVQLEHRRFGVFEDDPVRLSGLVGDVSFVASSTDTDQAVVVAGTYTDVTHGTLDAAVVAVADGSTCRWVRIPDTGVAADLLEGDFEGTCEAAAAAADAAVSP